MGRNNRVVNGGAGHSNSRERTPFSRHETPEFGFGPSRSSVKRVQGRLGAGWHPWPAVLLRP